MNLMVNLGHIKIEPEQRLLVIHMKKLARNLMAALLHVFIEDEQKSSNKMRKSTVAKHSTVSI